MNTLTVIMSNDCRPYVTAKPCIPFSRNIVQIVRVSNVSRIEVWSDNDNDRKLWEESWGMMRSGQNIPVMHRNARGSPPYGTKPMPMQEMANETQADAWDLLLALIDTAPPGRLTDASEDHDRYLYGDRL